MIRSRMLLIALMFLAPTAALAHDPGEHPADPNLHVDPALEDCSVQFSADLTQEEFHRFAREFGTVSAFKQQSSPVTLGRGRLTVGLEYLSFRVDEKSGAWNDTFAHPNAFHELGTDLAFPKARVRVGVTDVLDLGAFYTRNTLANYGWLGLDAKYGLLRQSQTMPLSVSVRGAYTKTLYVRDMDMHAVTVDVSAGRTFWNVFTPYVTVGSDAVLVRETSRAVDLKTEMLSVSHALAGCEFRYWHLALGAEAQVGALNSLQAQFSAAF